MNLFLICLGASLILGAYFLGIAVVDNPTTLEKLVDRIPHRQTSRMVRQLESMEQRLQKLEAISAATEFDRKLPPQ